jgi:hypothetical protein
MSETKQLCIEIPKGEIARFCQRHQIRKLSYSDLAFAVPGVRYL